MNSIDLEDALQQIHTIYNYHIREERVPQSIKPFIFIVGAGVSLPYVPSASGIISDCKSRVSTTVGSPSFDNTALEYEFYLKSAFPTPKMRQEYFRDLIINKPIPKSVYLLTLLLSSEKFSDTIITPNFDDFIEKSLRLINQEYISIDHPSTFKRITFNESGIKIIHVHGLHYFYDICNSDNEIEVRTNDIEPFIREIIKTTNLIVLGYSGWESDPVMTALKSYFGDNQTLPHNIYWFCYKRENVDLLPDWLKVKQQVLFVLPEDISEAQFTHIYPVTHNQSNEIIIEEDTLPIVGRTPSITQNSDGSSSIPFELETHIPNHLYSKLGIPKSKSRYWNYVAELSQAAFEKRFQYHAEDILDLLIYKLQISQPEIITSPLTGIIKIWEKTISNSNDSQLTYSLKKLNKYASIINSYENDIDSSIKYEEQFPDYINYGLFESAYEITKSTFNSTIVSLTHDTLIEYADLAFKEGGFSNNFSDKLFSLDIQLIIYQYLLANNNESIIDKYILALKLKSRILSETSNNLNDSIVIIKLIIETIPFGCSNYDWSSNNRLKTYSLESYNDLCTLLLKSKLLNESLSIFNDIQNARHHYTNEDLINTFNYAVGLQFTNLSEYYYHNEMYDKAQDILTTNIIDNEDNIHIVFRIIGSIRLSIMYYCTYSKKTEANDTLEKCASLLSQIDDDRQKGTIINYLNKEIKLKLLAIKREIVNNNTVIDNDINIVQLNYRIHIYKTLFSSEEGLETRITEEYIKYILSKCNTATDNGPLNQQDSQLYQVNLIRSTIGYDIIHIVHDDDFISSMSIKDIVK